ncbi:MAG: hypothetical protein WBN69_09700, partial [Eudoraea sp.]
MAAHSLNFVKYKYCTPFKKLLMVFLIFSINKYHEIFLNHIFTVFLAISCNQVKKSNKLEVNYPITEKIDVVDNYFGEEVLKGLYRLLKFCGYFLWLYVILGLLKIREILIDNLLNFITKPLKIGELSISIGNVITFFLIIQLSLWISQFIRYFLDKEVYPRTKIDKGVASTFSIMIKYTLILLGFMLALAGAGVKYSNIAIGLGALGVGIGFG